MKIFRNKRYIKRNLQKHMFPKLNMFHKYKNSIFVQKSNLCDLALFILIETWTYTGQYYSNKHMFILSFTEETYWYSAIHFGNRCYTMGKFTISTRTCSLNLTCLKIKSITSWKRADTTYFGVLSYCCHLHPQNYVKRKKYPHAFFGLYI